jgi:hypothetical protein
MRYLLSIILLPLLACSFAAFGRPVESRGDAPEPATAAARPGASRVTNAAELRRRLGLTPEYDQVPIESVKVAVLDYGFDGIGNGRRYLPGNTVVVEHYDPDFVRRFQLGDPGLRKPFEPGNRHGRTMAQIVWAITGSHPTGPQFYLLNANGPTMLRRAVRYAIEQKVDIILFSGSFEGGGNGDGRGSVNRIVADALAAGILWINAAGNYGHCVYNGPVRVGRDGYLRFRENADGTSLRFRNRLDENTVTVTLTWNDYHEEEDAGTDKDLDLFVENAAGKVIGSSELKQVLGNQVAGAAESRNPRERVVLTDLPADLDFNYRIRVYARAGRFTEDDRIRVLVKSSREIYVSPETKLPDDALTFFDATGKGELFPPADNPLVLTVGDDSPASASGPTADHRVKPEVLVSDPRAFFSDGDITAGSSNAAACVAGVVAVLKAAEPSLAVRHLLRLAWEGTSEAPSGPTNAGDGRSAAAVLPTRAERRPLAPSARLASAGSRGQVWIITGSRPQFVSDRLASSRLQTQQQTGRSLGPELAPMPRPKGTNSDKSTAPWRRFWRTPGRVRLAELVAQDR